MAVCDDHSAVRVTPAGELGPNTVGAFLFELDEAVLSGRSVVIDLRDVPAVGPAALEALAEAERYLRRSGASMMVVHPSPSLRTLLEDLGFARVLAR